MPGLQISCTIPMCLAMRRSHQLVKICDVFLHFLRCWACTLNILQFQGPKRSCECEAILVGFGLHVELFCKPTLGSQVSASQLMRSTRHFGPYPHPIKFDFAGWIYVETMVYIHLANSWDHDFMCPSLIFPHQKTGV